jgi:hypothetical protein
MGLKPGHAAGRPGLSVRQVERLVTRYQESGATGLVSRKRGLPGADDAMLGVSGLIAGARHASSRTGDTEHART